MWKCVSVLVSIFSAILVGLSWLSYEYLMSWDDMRRWVLSPISMEEKVRRALTTPEEIASLQREKATLGKEVSRLEDLLEFTEKENKKKQLEQEGDNAGKARRIEVIEAERKDLLARVARCDKECQSSLQQLTAKHGATTAACQRDIRAYQLQLKKAKQDCIRPSSNIQAIIEGKTVYLVKEGGKKEKVFGPINTRWEYVSRPLLNPSSTLLSFLAQKTGYQSYVLVIKDSLSRTEITTITMEEFSEIRNLRWVGERVIRVYLDPDGSGDINEHRIMNEGHYELEFDKHTSLKSVTRVRKQ
uniref:Uncharacterized protein n=1 Tax=Candidatus Kentrum sp. FM TaxID=2126340 RepID=A0A450VM70_9GAMM|nr:MAG: hypothetical protein BECKFM1743C_GA0114222_100235 [Candidatus Kentron sp. FM]VFJ51476.1 MAG: hypothetical protein BECKFM1743A_GA0114220_100945 [Candidatus Kentron sp. FM]VFK05885.1 MAG: hypothetical protein BECKFM1743B_GA0114221_100065 [Candidatus Kentron sp. FM]